MTHRTGIRLPASVTLPDDPMITARNVREALGASRAVLHYWRAHHQFPGFQRVSNVTLVRTDALSDWLERFGVTVRRLPPAPPATPAPLPSPWPPGTGPLEAVR